MSGSDYQPLSRRRRLLVVLLAVATAVAVVMLLLDPPGGVHRHPPQRVDRPPCADGQTQDCVGGTTRAVAVPASATAR